MGAAKLNQPLVVLARHGQTDYNSKAAGSAERLRGWKNVPLNAAGQTEANRLAGELKSYPLSTVLSSDLSRAMDTAAAIAKPHNLPVIPAAALRPWNLGEFQGKPVSGIEDELTHYVNNPDSLVPGGESFNKFKNRYLTTLQLVLDHAKATGKSMALVSHTRNAQLTKAWFAAGGTRDFDVSTKTMNNYDHEPHTGDHLILLHSPGGWNIHNVSNSEPRSYKEYNETKTTVNR